jgi:hypothetical protein
MKIIPIKYLMLFVTLSAILLSCTKDETKNYADPQDTGLNIFSDKGFNTMSCYINSQPWRTVDRTTGGIYNTKIYEVHINRQTGTTGSDTLQINWQGSYNSQPFGISGIILNLPVPHGFSYTDFSSLQGKKLHIENNTGYFFTENLSNPFNTNGTGDIYFNKALLDSVSPTNITGEISGLFDATIDSFNITNGRFDNSLNADNASLSK